MRDLRQSWGCDTNECGGRMPVLEQCWRRSCLATPACLILSSFLLLANTSTNLYTILLIHVSIIQQIKQLVQSLQVLLSAPGSVSIGFRRSGLDFPGAGGWVSHS